MSWWDNLKWRAPKDTDMDSLIYSVDCVIRLCRYRLDKLAQKIEHHTASADFSAVAHRINTIDPWAMEALQAEAELTTAQMDQVSAAFKKLGREFQSPDARKVKIDLADKLVYTFAAHGFELSAGKKSPLYISLVDIVDSELPELRPYIAVAIRSRKKLASSQPE